MEEANPQGFLEEVAIVALEMRPAAALDIQAGMGWGWSSRSDRQKRPPE